MAKLWLREYGEMPQARNKSSMAARASVPLAMEPGLDQAPVTFTTAAASAAFGTGTRFIAATSDVAFHFVVGANPTATTSHLRWPAGIPLWIGVEPGHKISVVAAV